MNDKEKKEGIYLLLYVLFLILISPVAIIIKCAKMVK